MKDLILIILTTFGTIIGFSQDSLKLDQLKFLKKTDTLVVDIEYIGNRYNRGDRYIVFQENARYSLIHFRNFHRSIPVDGFILTDSEKQDYLLKNINEHTASSSVTINQITKRQFNDIITELELLLNSEKAEEVKYYEFNRTKRSYLIISLNDFIVQKMYKGWIEINKN
jgi:hypothetical protein